MTGDVNVRLKLSPSMEQQLHALSQNGQEDLDTLATRAVSLYLRRLRRRAFRISMQRGYCEMADINARWSESCIGADYDCECQMGQVESNDC